jgi:flagellin-like hook-associated protein FlgL
MSEPYSSPATGDAGGSSSNENGSGATDDTGAIQQELPFLVTHWLANYDNRAGTAAASGPSEVERQQAMARIHHATSEIASALATLGAYGTTVRVCDLKRVKHVL